MLLPDDPEGRSELWTMLESELLEHVLAHVVTLGKGDANAVAFRAAPDQARTLVARMKSFPISRISANRGTAISPHFSGSLAGGCVTIAEFIATPSDEQGLVRPEKLRRDIEVAVISLLHAREKFGCVIVPLDIPPWEMKDVIVKRVAGGLEFRREN
jgi:hypothetical protein